MTQIKKKSLYFDIDGTILDKSTKAVKKYLQNGQLEQKIRNANFEKLFCMGNVNDIFKGLEEMGQHVDSEEIVYTLCFDAFTDFDWFVNTVCCTKKPDQQIKQIDFNGDWWYLGSSVEQYFGSVEKDDILTQHKGNRIFIPIPDGEGQDIISWLETIS